MIPDLLNAATGAAVAALLSSPVQRGRSVGGLRV